MREPGHVRGMVVEQMQLLCGSYAGARAQRATKIVYERQSSCIMWGRKDVNAVHCSSRTLVAITALCVLSACEQQHTESSSAARNSAPVNETAKSAVTQATVPPDNALHDAVASISKDDDYVIAARAVIADLPTRYSAGFKADRLHTISETRDVGSAHTHGRYEYYGARLTRYSGEQLVTAGAVQLEFDLQGNLLSASSNIGESDIEAIKSRGELLRSHALAQRASRTH